MVDFSKCKSFSEMGRLLGYSYYNGNVKKIIIEICSDNGIDPYKIIATNKNKPKFCLNCGKEITGKDKSGKKFCNSSCAASFNNKGRKHSDETKKKIHNTLHRKYCDKILTQHNLVVNDDILNDDIRLLNIKPRICVVCGEIFKPTLLKNGKISKSQTCSDKCRHILISNNCKKAMDRVISEGRHQGWKSRNIISYPECFWINVLKNNNIEYKHNHPFGKYFLDFYIEINNRKIDLEIDGKQHKYEDRHNSDIVRDEFVKSRGVEVFRIDWNSINTEDGKILMKEKIKEFLNFIGKI